MYRKYKGDLMKPKEAYLNCFFEQVEKLTNLHQNDEYLNTQKEVSTLQKQLIESCMKSMDQEDAILLVESMMNIFYTQMQIREKAIFMYAYKEGVKFGSELLK